MKTTKLYSRITTLFLFLFYGIAIGAKSAGLDTFRFAMILAVLGVVTLLHFKIMHKKNSRYHSAEIAK